MSLAPAPEPRRPRRQVVVGIDLGKNGALVALDEKRQPVAVYRTTEAFTVKTKKKGSKKEYFEAAMRAALAEIARECDIRMVCVEKGSVRPGEGIAGALSVGVGEGIWRGLVVGLGLPLKRVAPQTWQAKVCRDVPGDDPKGRSILAAGQQAPAVQLVQPGCRVKHDGIADATCICIWGWDYAKPDVDEPDEPVEIPDDF